MQQDLEPAVRMVDPGETTLDGGDASAIWSIDGVHMPYV